MADTKISALTALTGANVEQAADKLAIVDDSVTTTKSILVSELGKALLVVGTMQASTSGTSIDFTSIPAWAKKITISFSGVSTNGTSNPMIQIGDSGGLETSGYLGSAGFMTSSASTFTTGFGLSNATAATSVFHGIAILALMDASTNLWAFSSVLGYSNAAGISLGGGSKALSATLDRLSLTTVNGSDTFDAGNINILYE